MELRRKTFEELTNQELYELLRLRAEVFVVEQDCIYQDLDDRDQAGVHFFAVDQKQVVGCVRLLPKGVRFNDASIGRVVLKKELRGSGLANQLINAAIDYARSEWKEETLRISAQAHLQKFYGRFGFKTVSDEYLEDGIKHVEMVVEL